MHALSSATQPRTSPRIAPAGPAIALALFILVGAVGVTANIIHDATTDNSAVRAVIGERPSYDHYRFVEENTWLAGDEHWIAPQAGDQYRARTEKPALDFTREWRRFSEANGIGPGDVAQVREPWFLNPNLSRGGLIHA